MPRGAWVYIRKLARGFLLGRAITSFNRWNGLGLGFDGEKFLRFGKSVGLGKSQKV